MTSFVTGVYEIAIPVADLDRAEGFYRSVLGFEVVLQETASGFPAMHVAFTVPREAIAEATAALTEHGVVTDGPHFHAWMPATSVYFSDPDGHALELCAPGPAAP